MDEGKGLPLLHFTLHFSAKSTRSVALANATQEPNNGTASHIERALKPLRFNIKGRRVSVNKTSRFCH